MQFTVTLCLGHGDGGDVCVSVGVSDAERSLLKECYRDGEEINGYEGLEDLCEKIKKAAINENECCMADIDSDEKIDYDRVSCIIQMPDEITDEVDSEDEEDNEDEDAESVEWDDYVDYPFAMEVVNGEIISLTEDFQKKIKEQICSKLQVTEKELISYLVDLEEDEADDKRFDLISGLEYDALSEILGFDRDEMAFCPEGIGFLDSGYGWEAEELLEKIGFTPEKNIDYGPHGHGTNGVIYVE